MSTGTVSLTTKLLLAYHPEIKYALCSSSKSSRAIRRTAVSWHLRRRFSSYGRMLDMGGAPSGWNDDKKNATRINASKNCKVQAVCFDFDVLTRSIGEKDNQNVTSDKNQQTKSSANPVLGDVKPNVSMIEQVAGLLNVDLGGIANRTSKVDDLSGLTVSGRKEDEEQEAATKQPTSGQIISTRQDPRAKYAAKLQRKGVEGGVAGVELAKHQIEETLRRGDAAGHLAARKLAAAEPVGKTKWMAVTGTGSLLQYLSQRSMKLCLLPQPRDETDEEEGRKMEDFEKQLSNVEFELLVKDGSRSVPNILDGLLTEFKLDPTLVLVVSDRDDYIRSAKEKGMVTCRVRPTNARRGNVSAHYMVPSVPDVKDVVDEINGISFNAVLKGR